MRNPKNHGMSDTREYKSWESMVQRCTNKNNTHYKYYGGRGIKICDKWLDSFMNFYADMGDRPEGMSIDRIENNKGYSKDNCKWSTRSEQNKNRRKIGMYSNNRSGFRGVRFYQKLNKWVSTCSINGKRIHIGYFSTPEEASEARSKVLTA